MGRLLHISDLHLGEGTNQDVGDYNKEDLVPEPMRKTRVRVLEATLVRVGDPARLGVPRRRGGHR